MISGNRLGLSILIALIIISGPIESTKADDNLSFGDVAAIGASSSVIGLTGWKLHSRKDFKKSLINGPLPGELSIMRTIGGSYYPGKTNFLDTHVGSAIAPVGFAVLLISADLAWSETDPTKNTVQDFYLYGMGYIVTTGLTSIFKHTFRRPRPYILMADSIGTEKERSRRYQYASFISGHSSAAFFSAAFLNLKLRTIMRARLTTSEYHDWRWAPPTILYGWATLVAWSRVHAYKHYPSDVALGAMVGYLAAELFYSFSNRSNSYNSTPSGSNMLRIQFSF